MRSFKQSLLALSAMIVLLVPHALRAEQANPQLQAPPVDLRAPAVAGQFIVKFKPTTAQNARQAVIQSQGGSTIEHLEGLDLDVVEFPALVQADAAAEEALYTALKNNPAIEFIEPNALLTAQGIPNDPAINQQWAWGVIDAYQAWDVTQGSSNTSIAIVDTGIQLNHPDLDAKIVPGYDYVSNDPLADDGNGHGTHLAGTAAAETNNSVGGAGACPNCRLMPIRVLDNNGSGTIANVAKGIIYAADNNAKVINLSLGGSGSTTLQQAVDYAWNKGAFLACAAGGSNSSTPSYPAGYTNCFAVAATTNTDTKASSSNYGLWVELAAPGSNIYSTWIGSGYRTISGTSTATAHVSGVAGLLASQGLSNSQIRDRLCSSAEDIAGTGTYWSCGRLNAYNAVNAPVGTPTATPTPSPVVDNFFIANGSFENGSTAWVQSSSANRQLISTTRPRTGSYSAYFGSVNNVNEKLYQTVNLAAGMSNTLTFYYYMTTTESGSTAYDYLRVRIYNTSGSLLGTIKTYSNASTKNMWVKETLSLAAYGGQTVRLQFDVTTDSSLPTAFFIDDVFGY